MRDCLQHSLTPELYILNCENVIEFKLLGKDKGRGEKDIWGNGGITPLILNLCNGWRCQLHIPAHLPAVKGLDAGWASEEVCLLWRKNLLPLAGIEQ
jgi:hypothetical protein